MTATAAKQAQSPSKWEPPPDPDFVELAVACETAWRRDRPSVVSFDTETSGFLFSDRAFCVTFAWPGESHYVELKHSSVDVDRCHWLCREILTGARAWVGHNIKFDINKVLDAEIVKRGEIPTIHDTEALAHLDDEHRRKGLKDLAVTLLHYDDTIEVEIKSGKRKGEVKKVPRQKYELEEAKKWAKKEYGFASVGEIGYDVLPRGVVVPYAIKDAEWTYGLYNLLGPVVKAKPDLYSLYKQEMELTNVLLDMERAGLKVDEPYVEILTRRYSGRVLDLHLRIEKIVGKEVRIGKINKKERHLFFNPSSSSPDVGNYLTAAGFRSDSYDADHLQLIDHPLARVVLELREDEKILNSYFRPIRNEVINGLLHPNIRQHGTVTGRVSSGKETG